MNSYLSSVKKQFEYYRRLGEKAVEQMSDEALFYQYNEESNSVATIIKHLHGNMLSRWTDFLNSDGEKSWRNRDDEFENTIYDRTQLLELWENGWNCFFNALNQLEEKDLETIVYIRNMGHTVMEAINRQLAHYPYHIGQIVFLAKMTSGDNWISLSIAKGDSNQYNQEKFSEEKGVRHFTDEFLK
ncbi:MAG: DUF1572 family protein [Saprospiraceae bacterium]